MIRAVGFFDTWALASTLFAKYRENFVQVADGLEMFAVDERLGQEWRSLKAFLTKVRVGATPQLGYAPVLAKTVLARLGPGAATPWNREADEDLVRLHTCLVPGPAAFLYSGASSAVNPLVGQVNWVDHKVLNSWANFGDTPTIHVVVDLRKPPDEAAD